MSQRPLTRNENAAVTSYHTMQTEQHELRQPLNQQHNNQIQQQQQHSHSHDDNSHSHSHNHSHSHSHSSYQYYSSPIDSGATYTLSINPKPRSSFNKSSSDQVISPDRFCGGLESNRAQHNDANTEARRKLWIVSSLCLTFMIGEVVGGLLANSLAVMTDAAHLLSDLAGFLISIFALWLATRAPTSRLSYGFHRAEILGALISVILIWLLTGILVYEAAYRIKNPEEVDGKLMFIVAACGLGVNIAMGVVLHQSGHSHSHGLQAHSHNNINSHQHSHASDPQTAAEHIADINVHAAFVHVLGDAIQSIGVMLAAALIWYNPEWRIADPLTTFLFSLVVLFTTARLIKQSVSVLMEGVPEGIDPAEVERELGQVEGVLEVHDLHIWSLSVGKPSLSVHLLASDDSEKVLQNANTMLKQQFNITHSTIQIERKHDQVNCNPHYR